MFRTYLDVVHIKRTDQKRMQIDRSLQPQADAARYEETDQFDTYAANDEERILELSRDPNVYDKLASSMGKKNLHNGH